MHEVSPVQCPYCRALAELVDGTYIYPHRTDLHDKQFYRCVPCDAYVGCHPGTTRPLGRLANGTLRRAKMQAHDAFDPLWKCGGQTRSQAYSWLAGQLGIDTKCCHIGEFDAEMCHRVVEVCRNRPRGSCPVG